MRNMTVMTAKFVLFSILLGLLIGLASSQDRRRTRRPRVSAAQLQARIVALEDKLTSVQQDLSSTQQELRVVSQQAAQGGATGSALSYPPFPGSQRLRDLPRCPVRAMGFHFAETMRSCYYMEPRDVLVNKTEAVRICKNLSPKANLVAIETEAEQLFLQILWQTERGVGSLSRFWTSGIRRAGKWSWQGSRKPFTYSFWIPTTSHDDDRFSCMAVHSNEAYNWGDVACWAPHLITCEINV